MNYKMLLNIHTDFWTQIFKWRVRRIRQSNYQY